MKSEAWRINFYLSIKKIVAILSVIIIGANISFAQTKTITENFLSNVGDTVIVSGKIYGGAWLVHVNTKPTFLNLGDTSPSHRLIIRIEPEDRNKFPSPPETYFLNKIVSVTGKLQEYKGLPLIKVSEPAMIKTDSDMAAGISSDTNALPAKNIFIAGAKESNTTIKKYTKELPASPVLQAIKPNAGLQSAWIKSVTEKAAEEKSKNIRIVEKDIVLKTAPYKDAPVIAILHPGMLISILYTSKKWSYISIGSIEGFNNVNGFIRHKRFRHLKKADEK